MYLTWKRMGHQGLRNRVEHSHETASYFASELKKRDDFVIVTDTFNWNVCFWYIPKSLKGYKNIEDIYPKLD